MPTQARYCHRRRNSQPRSVSQVIRLVWGRQSRNLISIQHPYVHAACVLRLRCADLLRRRRVGDNTISSAGGALEQKHLRVYP